MIWAHIVNRPDVFIKLCELAAHPGVRFWKLEATYILRVDKNEEMYCEPGPTWKGRCEHCRELVRRYDDRLPTK